MEYKNLERVLDEFGKEFVRVLSRLITEEQGIASGNLLDTIESEGCFYRHENGHYTVYLGHPDYFEYYDKGTRPHWAPIQPLKDWVEAKQAKQMLPQVEGLPYMIQWKIARDGTEARNVFDRAKQEVIPHFVDRFAEALRDDMIDNWLSGEDWTNWGIFKV